ncbi:DUF4236 domain-containing protein [Gordonia hankookensis]|uniref:DUF4236 domain-containing protein n=1 Tax=Gordonia hankookensis TaxID=589403 RepID=A0ABR7W884_9ACTN|nr:DUF4236 domain-containing protein [Gordonia hankookensis]MBD1318002.1 DUF4236 domain-containing protein [Gordonia hankookensis]
MGARFRKTINLGGGVKINLNAKSASISAGAPGARVTYNTRGQRTTSVGVPGTGVSYRTTKKVTGGSSQPGNALPGDGQRHPASAAMPQSRDEKKFTKAVGKSAKKPEVLGEWLAHPDLGEAANVVMGVAFWAGGHLSEAKTRFAAALAGSASTMSAGFYARHPAGIPLEVLGATALVPVSRSGAALMLASIYNQGGDLEAGLAALGAAEPSEFRTALEAAFLYNLGRYDDVVFATRWLSGASTDPLVALGLILRGCALRGLGKLHDARMALDGAIGGVSRCLPMMDLYDFERAKTYAADRHGGSVARMQLQALYARNPNYPGLEEALAELPAGD